jgi:hypothetical protein
MRHLSAFVSAAALGLSALTPAANAQSLTTAFTYQGELRQSGTPATGTFDLQFKLYDSLSAGTQIGTTICIDNTAITGGRFTQTLDFGNAFNGQKRFIEVAVRADASSATPCSIPAGFTTLSPRQELTAAPNAAFALTAASATSAISADNSSLLNGQNAAFYQNASSLSTGIMPDARLSTNIPRLDAPTAFSSTVSMTGFQLVGPGAHVGDVLTTDELGIGTWQPPRLQLPYEAAAAIPFPGCTFSITSSSFSTAICGYNTSLGGPTIGIQGGASSPAGTGIVGSGATGVRGEATFPNGYGVDGFATKGTGVQGRGDTGVRGESLTPNGNGVVGYASGGNDAWAVAGETVTGQAVIGRAGNSPPGGGFPRSAGVVGYTNVSTGFVYGIGVYGEAAAPTGLTKAGSFRNSSNAGTAVEGFASSTTGQTFGGDFGTAGSNFAVGVRGVAVASSGNTFGGDFAAESTDGIGVRAKANALTGFTWGGWFESRSSTFGTGVYGYATSPTGVTYGVHGRTLSSDPNAWGVFATGRLGATGAKSFRIDHPQDPDNKYLLHYCTESPEVLNAYSGKVTLDANGEAIVELPAYFASINKDPRYTLTPIGAAMPLLHVGQEINKDSLTAGAAAAPGQSVPACTFRIAGGVPGAKVSWRVEAVRNDRWVRENGAPVELAKTAAERDPKHAINHRAPHPD